MNTTEVVQPSLFPFPFPHHLIFCCLALVFFGYLYAKYKKPHQLIMAIAIPFSLVIWISSNRTLFYAVGIIEVLLMITALVLNIMHRKKYPQLYEENQDNQENQNKEKTE